MTIKTLEHIHNVLLEKERNANLTYQNARKLQYEYEDNEEIKAEFPEVYARLIREQKEAADHFYQVHSQAQNALIEFEAVDWR